MKSDDSALLIASTIKLVEFNGALGDRRVTGRYGVTARAGALLAAFNAHAFAVAEASIPLWMDEVLQVAARPLARVLYETGVFAQWIAHDPEAAEAMVAAFSEERRKLATNFRKAPRLAHLAQQIEAARPDVVSPRLGIASSFASVCDRFEDGAELYANYRILSGQTHTGVEIADQWLAQEEGIHFRVLGSPRPQDPAVIALGLMGLLLTASAFEEGIAPGTVDVTAVLDRISDEAMVPRSLHLKAP